jgi:RNA polymerase sigma-70 factor (ECF subfamily)
MGEWSIPGADRRGRCPGRYRKAIGTASNRLLRCTHNHRRLVCSHPERWLGGSTASINSALQRGRATLSKRYPDDRPRKRSTPDPAQRALIERYVQAWEGYDLDGFVSLLKEDATYAMPPWEQWYRGRDSIRAFFSRVWRFYGGFRLLATSANGQPAFALYSCKPGDSTYHAHSLQVLEIHGNSISGLTAFMKPPALELFLEFELPLTVSDARQ